MGRCTTLAVARQAVVALADRLKVAYQEATFPALEAPRRRFKGGVRDQACWLPGVAASHLDFVKLASMNSSSTWHSEPGKTLGFE